MTDIQKLKPYKSLIMAQTIATTPADNLVDSILGEAEKILELNPNSNRQIIEISPEQEDGTLKTGFIHYTIKIPTTWTREQGIEDIENHLFLIIQQKRYIAIYMSEGQRKGLITKKFNSTKGTGLGALENLSQYKLNNAFISGETRTLWLSGTHRRTSIKADSKILTGSNLRDALDPLQDQSYYFTAARSFTKVGNRRIPVGCSPRNSTVWTGISTTWEDFKTGVMELLTQVESASIAADSPLPVLAVPISANTANLTQPFDMAFIPPSLDDPTISQQAREDAEKWGYHSYFDIIASASGGSVIKADLYLDDSKLGKIEFDINPANNCNITWNVSGKENLPKTKANFEEGLNHARNQGWLKIWFESGLMISEGQLYEVRHRGLPFQNFKWIDFSGFRIDREKPKDPTTHKDNVLLIGQDNSLFDWALKYWPNLDGSNTLPGGWIACDDGAMEIADFIHLGDEPGVKVLSLIHVKASKTKGISVSDFEVVASQAVKNLRSLDAGILQTGLENNLDNQVGSLVWLNGQKQNNRQGFMAAIRDLGTNYRRRVVIVQPSLAQTQERTARNNPTGSDFARLRQLDTLLLGIESDCRALGAEFWVVCNGA